MTSANGGAFEWKLIRIHYRLESKICLVKKGVPSNVILQDYFFDAFWKRLAKSQYAENFVFKGEFLLSTTLGLFVC